MNQLPGPLNFAPNPAGYPDTLPPPPRPGAPPETVDALAPWHSPTDEELDLEELEDMGIEDPANPDSWVEP